MTKTRDAYAAQAALSRHRKVTAEAYAHPHSKPSAHLKLFKPSTEKAPSQQNKNNCCLPWRKKKN
tara:strand:- start:201 stop:395 length:195 start_codon:yes stop_codon:yes gene_type:complete